MSNLVGNLEKGVISLENKGLGSLATDGTLFAATVIFNNPAILADEGVVATYFGVCASYILMDIIFPPAKYLAQLMYNQKQPIR
jgi:hypothetical protein